MREGRDIGRFLDGFRWTSPGLVNVNEWRNPVAMQSQLILYGGIAAKPAAASRAAQPEPARQGRTAARDGLKEAGGPVPPPGDPHLGGPPLLKEGSA